VLQTDDVDTQWGKMMRLLGIKVVFALSPQAKGKVERPYRWLQDRIIRTCALENIGEVVEAREVLHDKLDRYNNHQVHSTTREIPRIRFERAVAEGNSLFRPFSIPEPYTSPDDVFCLREKRMVNAYRRISLFGIDIQVPHTPLREYVDVHMGISVSGGMAPWFIHSTSRWKGFESTYEVKTVLFSTAPNIWSRRVNASHKRQVMT